MNDLAKLAALAGAAYAGSKLIGKGAEGAPSTSIPITSGSGGDTGGYAISGDTAAMVAYVLSILHGEGVYVDATAAGGTAEPAGCRQFPCRTLAEARTVAAARGLNTYYLRGAFILDADMLSSVFIGDENGGSLQVAATTSINGSVFYDCALIGIPHLATIDYVAMMRGSFNCGTNPIRVGCINTQITTAVTMVVSNSVFIDCYTGLQDPAIFTVDGVNQFSNFNGYLQIGGMNAAGDLTFISGLGNFLDTASNTAGTITVYGNMRITAVGGGVTIVDRTNWSVLVSLLASSARTRCAHMAQWSAVVEEIVIQDGAGDVALPQIIISKIPAGAVVTHAHVYFKYGAKENTFAGVNKLSGAQEIQINRGGAGWVDCIQLVDDYFTTAASTREGGGIVIGDLDVAATVTGNATYTFQWDEALCDADFLFFNDIQIGLYIEYTI